jgi:hypothetical protein
MRYLDKRLREWSLFLLDKSPIIIGVFFYKTLCHAQTKLYLCGGFRKIVPKLRLPYSKIVEYL